MGGFTSTPLLMDELFVKINFFQRRAGGVFFGNKYSKYLKIHKKVTATKKNMKNMKFRSNQRPFPKL